MWGERIRSDDAATVARPGRALPALLGDGAGAGAGPPQAWVNYEALAGSLAPAHRAFDWPSATARCNWPRTGHEVLDVQAQHPDYWKAENLDFFNGRGWVSGQASGGDQLAGVDQRSRASAAGPRRSSVTIRAMRTTDVIAAGFAGQPSTSPEHGRQPGSSPGTWTPARRSAPATATPLERLHAASHRRPARDRRRRTTRRAARRLPHAGAARSARHTSRQLEVVFPPFHSHEPVLRSFGGPTNGAASCVKASRRTAARTRWPAARAQADDAVRVRAERRGLPARTASPTTRTRPQQPVPAGDASCSTTSRLLPAVRRRDGAAAADGRDSGAGRGRLHHGLVRQRRPTQYMVTDIDAHAWVEAWFPRYGWVRFDPTPAVAPARGGKVPIVPSGQSAPEAGHRRARRCPRARHVGEDRRDQHHAQLRHLDLGVSRSRCSLVARRASRWLLALTRAPRRAGRPTSCWPSSSGRSRAAGGRSPTASRWPARAPLPASRPTPPPTSARCGWPALRRRRRQLPTAAQRRALRGSCAAGLGIGGMLRALWALPPRWRPPEWAARRSSTPRSAY